VTFGPIATIKADKLSFTANPFFEKTFGDNKVEGIALNYAWQVKYEVRNGFAIGVEGFGVVEKVSRHASAARSGTPSRSGDLHGDYAGQRYEDHT
jgi:hypothetical protein